MPKKVLSSDFAVHILEDLDTPQDFVAITFPRSGQRGPGFLADRPSVLKRPAELMARLLDNGAALPLGIDASELASSLAALVSSDVGLFTTTSGWKKDRHGWAFLLPGRVVGNPAAPMILGQTDHCLAEGIAGTLESWKQQVATPAGKSTQVGAAILAALAAPLLNFADLTESFSLNLFGNSSGGKTTANRAAASVWGSPKRLASWNATDRSLEEIAAANCDLPLILDDAEQATKNSDKRMGKLHAASHVIASGSGKSYAKLVSASGQLNRLTFRCIGLSSSPVSVEKSVERTDGDRVRFLELAVPHGNEGGIWSTLDIDIAAASKRSDKLNQAVAKNHGAAGIAWLEFLVGHQDRLEHAIAKCSKKFIKKLKHGDSVEARIGKKCALLWAAGRLAIEAEILPWSRLDLEYIVNTAFNSIVASAFGERFDVQRPIDYLAKSLADTQLFPRTTNKAFRRAKYDENAEIEAGTIGYYLTDKDQVFMSLEHFKGSLAAIFQADSLRSDAFSQVVQFLQNEGVLVPGYNGGLTIDIRRGDHHKKKMVVLNASKLKNLQYPASDGNFDSDGFSRGSRK